MRSRDTLMWWGTLTLALGGCTTMRGAPPNVLDEPGSGLRVKAAETLVTRVTDRSLDRTGNPINERTTETEQRVESFRELTTRQEILNYSVEQVTAEDQRGFRNRVIDHYMGEIDRHYERYSQKLFNEGIQTALGFDTAIIGLSSTAALFEDAANDLATVISAFAGTQAAINKNLFFERTLPALIVTMDAERTKVETEIIQRKTLPMADYTLEAAIRDLRRYQQAGTLMRSVTKVTETASISRDDAERAYEAALGYSCDVDGEAVINQTDKIGSYLLPLSRSATGNPTAELKLRAVATVVGVDPQGTIGAVAGRIRDALDQGYCSEAEVVALIAKIEAVTKDELQ